MRTKRTGWSPSRHKFRA